MLTDDFGQTWGHEPGAFGAALPAGVGGSNFGPVIIQHPDLGLVAAGHAWSTSGQILDEQWLWTSQNDGRSWQLHRQSLTTPSKNVEPTLALVADQIAFLARSHDPSTYEPVTGTFRYSQGRIAPDTLAVSTQFTNIRTTDASDALSRPLADQGYAPSKAAAFGFWSQDTADVILNPITGRIEAVATNRTGRAADHVDDISRQSLSLWSIHPDDLFAGSSDWRYEGTLFERHMIDAPMFVDGMHPAGSIVDLENEVQHIFIYVGYYAGPSGIFKITRTLHTDQLAAALVPEPASFMLIGTGALMLTRRRMMRTPGYLQARPIKPIERMQP